MECKSQGDVTQLDTKLYRITVAIIITQKCCKRDDSSG